jgi:predicted AlkP superfamily phosphohydrolase/phosphomutase
MKKYLPTLLIIFILLVLTSCDVNDNTNLSNVTESDKSNIKLYWFIPDGMRADPDLFNIYKWAEEGKLPNIKKMMNKGSYGYSIPTFPSHTPTNFATLLTGTYPKTHGVADGPMHVEGKPLNKVSIGGFSSVAKKVEPIWVTLEDKNDDVLLLSMPGSTPPELDFGTTIRGRWGGWGADFHALNFESKLDSKQSKNQGRGNKLFFFGPELTQYLDQKKPINWSLNPKSFSDPFEIELNGWGSKIYGYVYDSTNDNSINYDRILFSPDKKTKLNVIKQGQWSNWYPIKLKWGEFDVDSHVTFNIIKLDNDGFFRIRLFYNNLNKYNVKPSNVANELNDNIGPMIDFVDNFPPQLIYYPEDKNTFFDEMHKSFDWHTNAIPYIINNMSPDIILHDIYSPNQMLTSRWWLGYIDPDSQRYNEVNNQTRQKLMGEVLDMYKRLDIMVGEILNNTDENTIVVLSSDHGAVPLNKWVRLNNLFADKGWLKFKINEETGEPIIDWDNSTVIYLKMDNIYIDPNGLDGNWTRSSGIEYDKLRNEVKKVLFELIDKKNDIKPVKSVVEWEKVTDYLDLPTDRVGDLIVANVAGYGWNEEMTDNLEIFSTPLKTGYKQAIYANETKGMWTPFIIMGPGIKQNHEISTPIEHVDQYPTIMKSLNYDLPDIVEGSLLNEVFE